MNNYKFYGLILSALLSVSCSADFDIVILNGRVIDPETQLDAIRHVGIKDGRIASITQDKINGKETIDATGLAVVPGFIDTHTHSSNQFNIKMAMMDGVTSAMDYELGGSNIAKWYDREAGKWPINYGTCVAHEHARMMIHDNMKLVDAIDATSSFELRAQSKEDGIEGWSVTVSTKEQINAITQILDKGLQEGALCIGTTPGYAKVGTSSYELFEVQKTAARYGRPIGSHTRFHTQNSTPEEGTIGADEVIANAMTLNAPLLYSHNNDYGWWEIEEKLKLARAQGYNLWSEYYPYAAGSTAIGAAPLRPEIWEKVLGYTYDKAIYDPTQAKYLSKEEYLDIAAKDPGRIIIAYNRNRFDWFEDWVKEPGMTVASDAMWSIDPTQNWDTDPAAFTGHPRTAGTHSRALRLAREHKVPLLQTINQLSYLSAYYLGKTGLTFFDKRGRMQEGMIADIVILNPDTVADAADYDPGKNGLPPVGMPHVLVNGKFVKRDNKAIKLMAGQPIRYPVEKTGRWQPVNVKQIK